MEPRVDVDVATAGEMASELRASWRSVQQAQAELTHRLRTFDLAYAFAASGALTTAAWLRGGGGAPDRLRLQPQEGHVCADGVNVHLGELQRVVGPALRRQLDLRDGGCRVPGCNEPPKRCEAHHLRHWADGGKTTLDNLALLCWGHHRRQHSAEYALPP